MKLRDVFVITTNSEDPQYTVELPDLRALYSSVQKESAQTDKDSALKLACYAKNTDAVRYLISIGANVNTDQNLEDFLPENSHDYIHNPMYISVTRSASEIIKILLQNGAKPFVTYTKKLYRVNPKSHFHRGLHLHLSLYPDLKERFPIVEGHYTIGDHFDIAQSLSLVSYGNLKKAFDAPEKSFNRLYEFIQTGQIQKVSVVDYEEHAIFSCYDLQTISCFTQYDQTWKTARCHFDQQSILHKALKISHGTEAIIAEILAHQPDLSCRDRSGNTPLMLAVQGYYQNNICRLLIDAGADLSLDQFNKEGKNLLDLISGDLTELIIELVDDNPQAISPELLDHLLRAASMEQNTALIKYLITKGADFKTFIENENPLETAMVTISFTILEPIDENYERRINQARQYCEFLIAEGANPNILEEKHRVLLQKLLSGEDPSGRKLNEDQIKQRKILLQSLFKFAGLNIDPDDLRKKAGEGKISSEENALGGLAEWMVSLPAHRPEQNLVSDAINAGLFLVLLPISKDKKAPNYALFCNDEKLGEFNIRFTHNTFFGSYFEGDNLLWDAVKQHLAKLTKDKESGESCNLTF